MGSGSFPFSQSDNLGIRLNKLADELDKIREEMYECVYTGDSGGGQYDNAASDGGYLEDIRIASTLIRKCVE
jgi:hypothetical protein